MHAPSPPSGPPRSELPPALLGGGGYIVSGQLVRGLIRLAGVLLLARLLLPRDYGLFNIALVLYGFFAALRDCGLSAAALRRPELNPEDHTRLFWFYVATGLGAGTLLLGAAPLVASYYAEPQLTPLLAALAAGLALAGTGSASRIALLRAHRFRTVTLAEVASFAAGTIVALGAAKLGAGPWALVLMIVLQEVVQAAWFLVAARWRPAAWPGLGASGRDLLAFGPGLTAFAVLNHLAQTLDHALVGAWFGAGELGLYGRASFIALLPGQFVLGPLTAWMVQTLAPRQQDAGAFAAWFGRVLRTVAYGSTLLAALMLTRPEWLVQLLLGARWHDVVPLVPCFALVTLGQLYAIGEVWVLMACGRATLLAGWTAVRLVGLALVCFAVREHGLTAVALAVGGWQLVTMLGSIALLVRNSPLTVAACLAPLARPVSVALLVAAAGWFTRGASGPVAAAAIVGALGLAALWPPVRRDVSDAVALRPRRAG